MKKYLLLFSSLTLSAALAHAQAQSGGASSGTSGQSGGQTGAATGAQSGTATSQQQTGTSANPGLAQPATGVGSTRTINEPAGAGPAAGVVPGNTNRVLFGSTNQVQFGGTNTGQLINEPSGAGQQPQQAVPFGGTNQPGFGTNTGANLPTGNTPLAGSGAIQEPSGAAAPRPQTGAAIPPGAAADAAFAQQLNAALSRGGATRIFFPQTRSTVTLVNQNGSILLSGVVSSEQERNDIEARVKNASGVNSVNNQLRIGTTPAPMIAPPGQAPAPGIPGSANPPQPPAPTP